MSSIKRLAQEINGLRRLALGHATSPQLANASVDGGDLEIRDGDGNRVGGIGLGDDGGFVIDYSGGPKPPRPRAPKVSADAGLLRVEWDGGFEPAEGEEEPLITADLDLVEIHASMDENFVPDRVQSFGGAYASLEGGSHVIGPLTETGTYYVRLVARSKAGKFSEPSAMAEQMLAIANVDEALTDAWITGTTAAITADGKNGIWRGPEAPEPDPDVPFKDGDIWFEMNEDGESIPNIFDESTGGWVSNRDARQSAIERVQEELRQDLDTVITDGSGTKNFYKPVAPKATDTPAPKEGDLWFDTSEAGANTVHVWTDGSWMSLADARVQEIVQAQEGLTSDLADADQRITDAFGELDAIPGKIDTAKQAAIDAAAADALAKANTAQQAAEDAAQALVDAIEGGASPADIEALQDYADAAAEAARVAAENAAQAKADQALADAKADATAKAGAAQAAAEAKAATAQAKADLADDKVQALLAAGNSIIPNGDFENPSLNIWPNTTYQAGISVIEVPHARSGTHVMRMDTSSANRYPLTDWRSSAEGRIYYAEVWVYHNDTDMTKRGRVSFYAQSELKDGSISGYYGADLDGNYVYVYQEQIPPEQWYRVSAYITTPPDTINIRVAPHSLNNETPFDFDDFKVIDVTESIEALREARAAQAAADEAHDAAGEAQNAADAAMDTANGLSKVLHGTTAATGTAPDGSVWFQHKGTLSGEVIGQWNRVNGSWSRTDISSEAIANLDVGKLTAGSAEIAELVAQKIFAEAVVAKTATADEFIGTNAILTGAVTAAKMKTGTITAESGIIGSINAGTITVGEMSGARIKANTITGDKLLVGGPRNLLPNGDLETGDATGWPDDLAFTTDAPDGYAGSVFADVNRTTTRSMIFGHVPVTPGNTLVFETWVKADKPGSRMYFEIRDQDAVMIADTDHRWSSVEGTGPASSYLYPIANYEVPTEWTRLVQTVDIRPGTKTVYLGRIYFNHSNGSERDAIQQVAGTRMYEQVGTTLIQGGAITTEKIAVGAITAESGIIGSIDANVITVGKIMGNQLDADAINGKTITGAKIRTASSGSRVELTHNGLKQYNSLGATIVDMTSGSFTLQGGSITGSTIKTASSGSRVEINTQGLKQYNSKNEVIAEMVDGSMVMTGVLEAENNVGQFQAGMAFPDGSSTSPGLRWNNIGGTGTWGGIATTNTSRGPGLAMQGPGGTGKYAFVDLSIEKAVVRANSTSTRYAYLNVDPAAGEGINLTRSTSANGGSWVTMKDDVSVFTWHGSDADQSTYLNIRANAYDLRSYDTSGALVSGLWATTSGTTLSAYKNDLELWGGNGTRMIFSSDGTGQQIYSTSIRDRTYSTSANMVITSYGTLGKISSARRFKLDEKPIPAAEYADALLSIDYKSWVDKTQQEEYERYLAFRESHPMDPVPQELGEAPQEPPTRAIGAVAEDFEDAGLHEFVVYDQFGQTSGLQYDRIGAALIPIVREQRDRIEALESRLEALEAA